MKAKNLFLTGLAMSLGAASANAEDLYLIKDGELQKGFSQLVYGLDKDGKPAGDTLMFGVDAPDGSKAAAYNHRVAYNDVRLYSDNEAMDLNQNYVVSIEFYVPETDIVPYSDADKRPCITCAFIADTAGKKCGHDDAFTESSLEYKKRFENAERGLKGGFKIKDWNTLDAFVYTTPEHTNAVALVLGWVREAAPEVGKEFPLFYIKNLKLTTDGSNKPFFAEDFFYKIAIYNGGGNVSPLKVYHPSTDESVLNKFKKYEGNKCITDSKTGVPFYVTFSGEQVKKGVCTSNTRMWEDFGTDGSGYYDTEILMGMNMSKLSDLGGMKESGIGGRVFYPIPMSGLEGAKQFRIDAIVKWNSTKWNAKEQKGETFATCTDHDSLALRMAYMFVDDPEEAVTATPHYFSAGSTPEKPEGDDTIPHLDGKWTLYNQYVDVDATKKYFCVVLDTAKYFSYVVGDLKVRVVEAGPAAACTGTVGYTPEAGITGYTMGEGASVEAVKGDNVSAVIYPNPATDVINVLDAEAVVVYNALGQVVASSASSQVNVSSLAAGFYTVKAQTANGTVVGKIVKR